MFQLRHVASIPCHDLSFCKVLQEFILGLDLCTFVSYGIVVLDFSHNCFLWFCHVLPNGEIVRVIIYCNWLIFWKKRILLVIE